MAGILNPKERIMDVILTTKGRLDLVNGRLDVKYASFTDHGCFYENDGTNVASPTAHRLMFEAFSSDSADIIIPETNNMGNLDYRLSTTGSMFSNGKMYQRLHPSSSVYVLQSGSVNLYDGMATTMSQSLVKFDYLSTIGTIEPDTEGRVFQCAPSTFTYDQVNPPASVDSLKPMMFDDRLTTLWNYQYLPPISNETGIESEIGSYPQLVSGYADNFEDLRKTIRSGSQYQSANFSTVSFDNNIIGQVFKSGESAMGKLIAIDAGEYYDELKNPIARIFYLGNIYTDSNGINKFGREISLIFTNVTGSDPGSNGSAAGSSGGSSAGSSSESTGGGSSSSTNGSSGY